MSGFTRLRASLGRNDARLAHLIEEELHRAIECFVVMLRRPEQVLRLLFGLHHWLKDQDANPRTQVRIAFSCLPLAKAREVSFHGYIHEAPNSLSKSDEQYWMQRSIATIVKHTGKRPRGNRSPLYNFSNNTADLLVEDGFLYDSSLMGDDVPYMLKTKKGELVELPTNWATDDWPPYVHSIDLNYVMQIMSPDRAVEIFMAEFEAMREAGGGLWIGIWHPFVSGRLSRLEARGKDNRTYVGNGPGLVCDSGGNCRARN